MSANDGRRVRLTGTVQSSSQEDSLLILEAVLLLSVENVPRKAMDVVSRFDVFFDLLELGA